MSELKVEERLVVAADFSPKDYGGRKGVADRVFRLAKELEGLGVYIKVNSILRDIGYDLIHILHNHGLKVMADLKLIDIDRTMATDGQLLEEAKPEIVTVMCCAGIAGMVAVKRELTTTEVVGVTVLTTFDDPDCDAIFTCSVEAGVLRLARLAQLAQIDGLVMAPKEVAIISSRVEITLDQNTPNVRPNWSQVQGDTQNVKRQMTPKEAIDIGARRIIMGGPIVGAKPNNEGKPQSPREAVGRVLEEMSA